MSPPDEMNTEWDALKRVAQISSSICQKLEEVGIHKSQHPLPPDVDSIIPILQLSIPTDVLAPLSKICLPEHTRLLITKRLNTFIADLEQQYKSAYRRTCLEALRVTNSLREVEHIHETYRLLTQRNLIPKIRSHVAFILAEVKKRQTAVLGEGKPLFNNEFTPVLEQYFQLNGYPSIAHRTTLAQKSGMTPRQIEVWFQNHRKRARQDGKSVHRLESDLPLKRACGMLSNNSSVEGHRVRSPTPVNDIVAPNNDFEAVKTRPPKPGRLSSVLEESDDPADNNKIRPPHAFPMLRNSEHPDPFPTENGVFKFPAPSWRRKPATTSIIPTEVDMDDFARQFHMRLNFINTSWKRERTPSKSDGPSFNPWFAPLRTIPPSAPLPALQRPRSLVSVSTSMLTSTIAEDPFTFVFPKPGESGQPVKTNVTCIVRLPVGPQQSSSSITERIDRSVDALDRERKGFRMRRRALHNPRPSTSRLASPGEIAGRKVTGTAWRGPSGLQTFGSRTSSFTSDTSSDDSSSPSTPPSFPNHSLHSDSVVESDDFHANFDDFIEVPSSPSFDFTFAKPPTEAQPSSPQLFDLTFTSPMNINTEPLSSRTFDFTFSKPVADRQPSGLLPYHTPLIFT